MGLLISHRGCLQRLVERGSLFVGEGGFAQLANPLRSVARSCQFARGLHDPLEFAISALVGFAVTLHETAVLNHLQREPIVLRGSLMDLSEPRVETLSLAMMTQRPSAEPSHPGHQA